MAADREERRAHPRYVLPTHVRVVDASSSAELGDVDDISIGGFRVEAAADAPLPAAGLACSLRLVPTIAGAPQEPIDVVAALRWRQWDPALGLAHVGFEFTQLSPQAVLQIDAFVQAASG